MKRTSLSKSFCSIGLMLVLSATVGPATASSITGNGLLATNQGIAVSTKADLSKNSESWGTRYDDGRVSQVRTISYFDHYRDKSASATKRPLKLIVVAVEWGDYDAVVGDENAAFAQVSSDRMAGGDEETNKRVSSPSRAFFANARKVLVQQQASLTRIGKTVPNRNINMVSFDFITNKGTFTIQQDRRSLENGTSPWSAMFLEALALKEKIRSVDK